MKFHSDTRLFIDFHFFDGIGVVIGLTKLVGSL